MTSGGTGMPAALLPLDLIVVRNRMGPSIEEVAYPAQPSGCEAPLWLEQAGSGAGHDDVLAGLDPDDRRWAGRHDPVLAGLVVSDRVDAERCQAADDRRPQAPGILADAAGERDRVQPREPRRRSGDPGCRAARVHVEGEPGTGVAVCHGCLELA